MNLSLSSDEILPYPFIRFYFNMKKQPKTEKKTLNIPIRMFKSQNYQRKKKHDAKTRRSPSLSHTHKHIHNKY